MKGRKKVRQTSKPAIFICAINGSSRLDGETARRVKAILKDAEDLGAKTKLINLAKHPLQFCDGNESQKCGETFRR